MPDIMDLIAEILDNPKLKNVASKIQSEYHDEPILRTAAQMARRLPKPLADAKPDQCCGMVCRGIPCRKRTFTETGRCCWGHWL